VSLLPDILKQMMSDELTKRGVSEIPMILSSPAGGKGLVSLGALTLKGEERAGALDAHLLQHGTRGIRGGTGG